jgi:hypothetical protein
MTCEHGWQNWEPIHSLRLVITGSRKGAGWAMEAWCPPTGFCDSNDLLTKLWRFSVSQLDARVASGTTASRKSLRAGISVARSSPVGAPRFPFHVTIGFQTNRALAREATATAGADRSQTFCGCASLGLGISCPRRATREALSARRAPLREFPKTRQPLRPTLSHPCQWLKSNPVQAVGRCRPTVGLARASDVGYPPLALFGYT